MKALTVWQPHASLMAIRAKRIETRGWSTSYRGPLAIHAAARKPDVEMLEDGYAGELYRHAEPFDDCVAQWIPPQDDDPDWRLYTEHDRFVTPHPMPLGAVVATGNLVDVLPIVGHGDEIDAGAPYIGWWTGAERGTPEASLHIWEEDEAIADITSDAPFGDYSPGRFGWVMEDVQELDEPIPAKGKQGLWDWRLDACPYADAPSPLPHQLADFGNGVQGCKGCGWMMRYLQPDIDALDAGDEE